MAKIKEGGQNDKGGGDKQQSTKHYTGTGLLVNSH